MEDSRELYEPNHVFSRMVGEAIANGTMTLHWEYQIFKLAKQSEDEYSIIEGNEDVGFYEVNTLRYDGKGKTARGAAFMYENKDED